MGEHRDQQLVTLFDMKTIFTSMQETITTRVVEDVSSVIKDVLHDDTCLSHILKILQSSNHDGNITMTNTITRKGEYPRHLDFYPNTTAASQTISRISRPPQPDRSPIPPGLSVPNILANIVPPADRWKVYIQQWNFADPQHGLHVALKEWEAGWIKHPAFAMKYYDRKLVALEFERLVFFFIFISLRS